MDSRSFEFLWRIENFSMLPHQNNEPLYSSTFKVGFLNNIEWNLGLYPRGYSPDYKDNLSCFLFRITRGRPIKIGFSLTIKSIHPEFNIIYKKKCQDNYFLFGENRGWHNFILLKELHDSKNGYLPQDILTLECQMWLAELNSRGWLVDLLEVNPLFQEKCASNSRIKVDKRCVTWPILKIRELVKCKRAHFAYVGSHLKYAPAFKILFRFSEDTDSDYAKIEITQTKSFSSSIRHFVNCKIQIVTALKEYQVSKEDTFLFNTDNKEDIWNFPDFIRIENLSDDRYVNPDNILYLLCEFSFTTGNEVSHAEIPTYSHAFFHAIASQSPSNHLANTIQKLYQSVITSQELGDVNLQVGDQTFPALKFVLCAQSPIFQARFKKTRWKKKTKIIEIKDVEPDTLKLMLDFLHSNAMKEGLSTEEILKLYSAASKYQIALLKHQCALLLLSMISTESLCEVLIVAKRHNDNFLLTHIHNFLKMHAVEVFYSSQWKEFQNEDPELFVSAMIQVQQDSRSSAFSHMVIGVARNLYRRVFQTNG